ncbi:phosphonate ABC transporter ATP-binding protein [Saccharopolyspora erythraea]|uniref:phosphonate ABC transporter ATP-binding protein n=1 Tax=Saccharopolyspora erythraea TaxID=1836 RepID=UPI001BAB6766|nr:phosphonate ABC transporter ATP-binding protein [Saccharopolyspora erythraea]QUH01866.1 phosphonate ABC transporter ATP-binding protein [Saccharopolyspora erythraea]
METDQQPVVRLRNVTKQFTPAVTALSGVTLEVAPAEIVVLLGLSGSGKSTLLRHVNGLHQPTSGTVSVLGTDVGAADERTLRGVRRRIGFIFQQFQLVGRLSVLENVCSGALGRLAGPRLGLFSYSKELRREALEHIDRVGLAGQVFQRTDTLSGGQQQRVAVARALMQRPQILLADEPVASLDPESAQTVMRLIRNIAIEDGLTVLCSLHQVDLALSWADRIIGLRDGQIVMEGTADELDTDAAMKVYDRVGPRPVAHTPRSRA